MTAVQIFARFVRHVRAAARGWKLQIRPERHHMKISKYGKTYDTSDGTEQHFEDPKDAGRRQLKRDLQSDTDRWQDDGGPYPAPPAARIATPPKPAWSVLSLRAMKEAMAAWLKGKTAREQQATERTESAHNDAVVAANNRAETAHRDRHRNAWENT
jgi:hypothetical protein